MTSSSPARTALQVMQRNAYVSLALEKPVPSEGPSPSLPDYLRPDPDYTSGRAEAEQKDQLAENASWGALFERRDLSPLSGSLNILAIRVDELMLGCRTVAPNFDTTRVCFGTLPAGGLDAYSFAVPDSDEYGIAVPEGFFYLTNLLVKVVVLLQPLIATPDGPVYLPSAFVEQVRRAEHPYVRFRALDSLAAYFLDGDPQHAMGYRAAIPFQDRFSYLLTGTELFLLGHELAHVMLGHLDHGTTSADDELEADALAAKVVQASIGGPGFQGAKTALCAFFFTSMLGLWEQAVSGPAMETLTFISHPSAPTRRERCLEGLGALLDDATPTDRFVASAVKLLFGPIVDAVIPEVTVHAKKLGGFSSRVMPLQSSHLGTFGTAAVQPLRTPAPLVLRRETRRLGLWLLHQYMPWSALELYTGLLDDDEEWARTCRDVLVSVEPLYDSYIPELVRRYREEDSRDGLTEYQLHLTSWLSGKLTVELGAPSDDIDPMSLALIVGSASRPAAEFSDSSVRGWRELGPDVLGRIAIGTSRVGRGIVAAMRRPRREQ